jgi:hypothetical protein
MMFHEDGVLPMSGLSLEARCFRESGSQNGAVVKIERENLTDID